MVKTRLSPLVVYQTVGYFAGLVILGLFTTALGPTLTSLANNTHSSLSEISLLFTTRSFGYLLGSLGGGRLYDRLPGHRVLVGVLLSMAVLYFLVPLTTFLVLLIGIMFLVGIGEGTLDVGSNTLLVWVHQQKVGPFMNALHFFFGVGAFIGPIIIAQALSRQGITAAYWVIGVCALPVAAWLSRLPSPTSQANKPEAQTKPTSTLLVVLIVLFIFMYVGAEVAFGGWISAYTISLGLANTATAAYLTSLFWGAFTIGRLLGIPIAARFRSRSILWIDLIGCLLSLAIILLWQSSLTAIIIGTTGLGLSMASIFPITLVWAGKRMDISGRIAGFFFMGAGAGGMFLPWLVGQLFIRLGTGSTMWVILVDLVITVASYTLLVTYSQSLKRQLKAV